MVLRKKREAAASERRESPALRGSQTLTDTYICGTKLTGLLGCRPFFGGGPLKMEPFSEVNLLKGPPP
jgi:hypothetical protein